jgi:hypothetical protein
MRRTFPVVAVELGARRSGSGTGLTLAEFLHSPSEQTLTSLRLKAVVDPLRTFVGCIEHQRQALAALMHEVAGEGWRM